jgi:hypothetical protein
MTQESNGWVKGLRFVVLGLAVFAAFAGFGDDGEVTPEAAKIDALLQRHWDSKAVAALPSASDEVFMRRAYLDLVGRVPTVEEAVTFLRSGERDRRSRLVASLLESEGYTARFYNLWADVLRYKSWFVNTSNTIPAAYGQFIRESLRANKPYDVFVREMLSAKGFAWETGAVGYYQRDPDMPLDNMALTARVFLGTRIECAQCHDHPFDKWKQTQFYRLAAYTFGNKQVNEAFDVPRELIRERQNEIERLFKQEKAAAADGGVEAEARRRERVAAVHYPKVIYVLKGCVGQLLSPVGMNHRLNALLKLPHDFKESDGKPFEVMRPEVPFGPTAPVAEGGDGFEAFANWVTSRENPFFTRVIVNRLWKVLFGVALVEPLDELHDDTVAMVPELEVYLVDLMKRVGYDMRRFLRIVAETRAYRAEAVQEEFRRGGTYHFQGPAVRRMTAEQVWDSMVAMANPEPDARNLVREETEARRIGVSHMTYDAFTKFDGAKLLEMAYARLDAERALEEREKAVLEEGVAAKRGGDKDAELVSRRKHGALLRERGEALVDGFLNPVLASLAQQKGGPDARPFVDSEYKVNPNPSVLVIETLRRTHIPGYGPRPKTAEERESETAARRNRWMAEADRLGLPGTERDAYLVYRAKAAAEWLRASELESPAPRGHFLRTMGQSDRDYVENANLMSSIPQALLMMNGGMVSSDGILSPMSPLMIGLSQCRSRAEMLERAYLAVLSRRPSAGEVARWEQAASDGLARPEDVVQTLLNTKQFLFVR